MSPDARWMCGLTLLLVPGIIYGGLTVLGVVSGGRFGMPGPPNLSASQAGLYRAGHAHAGVLMLLCLFLQLALDHAALPGAWISPARWAAPAAVLLVSGGFFAAAHRPALRFLLYCGAGLLAVLALTVGIGLLRA